MLVTDNGINFVGAEFAEFTQRNGIHHVTSDPAHPASNGMAEQVVRTFKDGNSQMQIGSMLDLLSRFLFTYRNTPQSTTGTSPAEPFQGRRLYSPLDLVKPDLEGRVVNEQLKQKRRHDSHARAQEFGIGQKVLVKNFGQRDKWVPATTTAKTGPVSYRVEMEGSGLSWRRHVDQIRARFSSEVVMDKPATELTDQSPAGLPSISETPAIELTDNSTETEPTTSKSPVPVQVETANVPRYPARERRLPDRLRY